MKISFLLFFFSFATWLGAQSLEDQVATIDQELASIADRKADLDKQLETVKLAMIQRDLKAIGLPSANYIEHSALALEYAENHEQARWVAHIIRPEITTGTVFRSNDFRPDPQVTTGTAVEADYFLKSLQADSTYAYDGYGYDRGHLAPSADFRWSAKALSESYFYSNMSPQRPEFNREGWAELEGLLRGYLYDHPGTQLYVVTGPVLRDDLPKVERSINGLSLPEQYFKVALDVERNKAIGFLMPNQTIQYPLETYATTVDEIEALTGLNFFNKYAQEAAVEAEIDLGHWIPEVATGDVEPLYMPALPRGHFNTVHASRHVDSGKQVYIAGTVVSTRYARSGNLWLNLDKKFPNQIFSVYIRKADLVNFSYDPQATLEGKVIAVHGQVGELNGTPTMRIDREEAVKELEGVVRR